MNTTPILVDWATPCSKSKELYFEKLVDGKNLIFAVKDDKFIYEFSFERPGPYQVADEAFLKAYQTGSEITSESDAGNTCILKDSKWTEVFNLGTLEVFYPTGLTHYIIFTADACLEILADKPPTIIKNPIQVP